MVRIKGFVFNICDDNLGWTAGPIPNDTFQIVFLLILEKIQCGFANEGVSELFTKVLQSTIFQLFES